MNFETTARKGNPDFRSVQVVYGVGPEPSGDEPWMTIEFQNPANPPQIGDPETAEEVVQLGDAVVYIQRVPAEGPVESGFLFVDSDRLPMGVGFAHLDEGAVRTMVEDLLAR